MRDQNFPWEHELWAIVTWVVWIVLFAGLFWETRCWRERILVVLLVANCLLGLIGAASTSFGFATVHQTRELSLVLWFMATLVSLSTIRIGPGRNEQPVK